MKIFELIWSITTMAILILFLIRWWRMTSDIREIKEYLFWIKNQQSIRKEEAEEMDEEALLLEQLKKKMEAQHCIVKVLANSTLEIWDRATWEEHQIMGKGDFFKLIYKNY